MKASAVTKPRPVKGEPKPRLFGWCLMDDDKHHDNCRHTYTTDFRTPGEVVTCQCPQHKAEEAST